MINVEKFLDALFHAPSSPVTARKALEIKDWLDKTKDHYDFGVWISVKDEPVNGSYDWKCGDKAIAWGGYAFEIEWDGDNWCSIGGDDFTHWMPLDTPCKN